MQKGEELQHLIERIRAEAVDAAETRVAGILGEAREKAAALVREAEQRAAKLLADAEKAAEAHTERSRRTLEQAARDLLISVGRGVEHIVEEVVTSSSGQALNVEFLQGMIVKLAEAYAAREGDGGVTLLIGREDQEQLMRFFVEQCRQRLEEGVQVRAENSLFRGFRVSLAEGRVHHDFSQEAIAEALMNLLRPELGAIVHRVAREESHAARGGTR